MRENGLIKINFVGLSKIFAVLARFDTCTI